MHINIYKKKGGERKLSNREREGSVRSYKVWVCRCVRRSRRGSPGGPWVGRSNSKGCVARQHAVARHALRR